jgi:hypothetical protein
MSHRSVHVDDGSCLPRPSSTYRPGGRVVLTGPWRFNDLVPDEFTRRRIINRGSPATVAEALACGASDEASIEQRYALIEHRWPGVRCYLAWYLLGVRPGDMRRLYPLLRDDRLFCARMGCVVQYWLVGSFLTHQLRMLVQPHPARDHDAAVAGLARAMLADASQDGSLPFRIRGSAVHCLSEVSPGASEPAVRGLLATKTDRRT